LRTENRKNSPLEWTAKVKRGKSVNTDKLYELSELFTYKRNEKALIQAKEHKTGPVLEAPVDDISKYPNI